MKTTRRKVLTALLESLGASVFLWLGITEGSVLGYLAAAFWSVCAIIDLFNFEIE